MMAEGLQQLIDELGKGWRAERSLSQLTLGQLIEKLEKLDGRKEIVGIGYAMSYRGYYSDLAFEPGDEVRTVGDLLGDCTSALGSTFTGYKGGDYVMDEHTPLWISAYGCCGDKLMGLNLSVDPITPVVEKEEH